MAEISTETVIIGGGQTGVPLARALAGAGRRVVLIERAHLGSSCVNFGCTPSKAMIASARRAADARAAAALGIRIPHVDVDFAAVMDRARAQATEARRDLEASFDVRNNPRLVTAHARLAGREGERLRVRCGDMTVLAERVVLNTGTRSARPSIPGLDQVPVIDAETWLALREKPRRLFMLGGGYIGLEMAQALQRLGCAVTLLQDDAQLAPREDREVAEQLQAALERDGCVVRLNAEPRRVEATAEGVRLHLANGVVEGTHLFVATGARPNTDDLGLETVGVETNDHGHVKVDDRLRTSVPGVWAGGDIRGGPAFTHTAYDDFRVLSRSSSAMAATADAASCPMPCSPGRNSAASG